MPPESIQTTMPLFPLGTVMYPGGLLNLQIFEVRYLELIRKCLQEKTPFGVVSLIDGAEVRSPQEKVRLAHLGTLVEIEHCENMTPTLLKVRAVGTQRFELLSAVQRPNGLWVGEIRHLEPELAVQVPEHLKECADLLAQLVESLEERVALADEAFPIKQPFQFTDCAWVANRWCELLPIEKPTRLQLLALDNPLIRLELISDILDAQGML